MQDTSLESKLVKVVPCIESFPSVNQCLECVVWRVATLVLGHTVACTHYN